MKLKIVLALVGLTGILAAFATTALATSLIGVTSVTARGDLGPLKVNTHFDNGAKVKIKIEGPIELVTQRIEVAPGGTVGWHYHPGENVNVVQQGTFTLYHAEDCTAAIPYGPNTAFPTHPGKVHLGRNNSATETVVLFATYFHPKTTPPTLVRIDAPSPGAGCPE